MRKIIATVFACLSLIVVPLVPAVASALEGENSSDDGTVTTTSINENIELRSTSTSSSSSSSSDDGTGDNGRGARLEKLKAELKTKLDDSTKKRLGERCEAAQKILTTVSTKQETAGKARTTAYTNAQTRLNTLVTQLKAKQVDTTKLESEIATLKTMTDDFAATLATYKTAASETAKLKCTSDVIGFKASLEDSRTNLKSVAEKAKAIRTYINSTIKPTLEAIKQQLQASSGSGSANTSISQ